MTLRLFVDAPAPLATGQVLDLPPGPARHVQVRRLQPGDALTLFDGRGGEWDATVQQMGRTQVTVLVGAHDPVEREAPCAVTLAVGMPANDRMDWLVEKATELGVAEIRPLVTERSVLRLDGELSFDGEPEALSLTLHDGALYADVTHELAVTSDKWMSPSM